MMRKVLVSTVAAAALMLGVGFGAGPAGATPNASRLQSCEHAAALKFANHARSGNITRARKQFNRDIARCKRKFG